MRVYELALVLRSSFSQVQRKKVVDAIKNLLKDLKVTKETEIGEKPLSYKIKKEDTGYYMDFCLKETLSQWNLKRNFWQMRMC